MGFSHPFGGNPIVGNLQIALFLNSWPIGGSFRPSASGTLTGAWTMRQDGYKLVYYIITMLEMSSTSSLFSDYFSDDVEKSVQKSAAILDRSEQITITHQS